MKKIVFILMLIVSITFIGCSSASTEVKTISADGVESLNKFEDFFNPVELVYANSTDTSTAIIVEKKYRRTICTKSFWIPVGYVSYL